MIICPLYIMFGKRNPEPVTLSLNWLMNAHFQEIRTTKNNFYDIMEPIMKNMQPFIGAIELAYTIFLRDKRTRDIGNFGTVVDKFFQDSLVKFNLIPDDSWEYVKKVSFAFGGIDKENPRCEVDIDYYEVPSK